MWKNGSRCSRVASLSCQRPGRRGAALTSSTSAPDASGRPPSACTASTRRRANYRFHSMLLALTAVIQRCPSNERHSQFRVAAEPVRLTGQKRSVGIIAVRPLLRVFSPLGTFTPCTGGTSIPSERAFHDDALMGRTDLSVRRRGGNARAAVWWIALLQRIVQ